MPYDDETRELIEETMDAVEKMLEAFTPDAFEDVRMGYREMRLALEADERIRDLGEARERLGEIKTQQQQERDRALEWQRQSRGMRARWTGLPVARRESVLLEALADERLTAHDLTEAINRVLGARTAGTDTPSAVYAGEIANLAKQMFDNGHVDRALDPSTARRRYVYFRKRGLDGPIADLERVYREGEN